MLWKVFTQYNDGRIVDSIVHSKEPIKQRPSQDGIQFSSVNRFAYEVEHHFPPGFVNKDGKRYLVPMWIEVHPETEWCDIKYTNPYAKPKVETNSWKVESNSGTYRVTLNSGEYKCNCMGYFRLKDRSKGCKHIIQIKNK